MLATNLIQLLDKQLNLGIVATQLGAAFFTGCLRIRCTQVSSVRGQLAAPNLLEG